MCTANADLNEYTLVQGSAQIECLGGGRSRASLSLDTFYKHAKMDWCAWSLRTDGFDLAKFIRIKFYFQPHPQVTYLVHWDSDYMNSKAYPWPWYHPGVILNRRNHKIIWSKSLVATARTHKIVMRPPAIMNDRWYFMRDLSDVGLLNYQVQLIDVQEPMTITSRGTNCLTLTGSNLQGQSKSVQNYWWVKDNGHLNGIAFTQPPADSYATALAKDIPYWQSLYGAAGNENVWIWTPEIWNAQSNRFWFKLSVDSLNTLIRSGPFVSKGLTKNISIYCKYKAYFKFGGPSPTEEISPGEAPSNIPPNSPTKASKRFSGLQIRDPATVGSGVAHSWEYRRGLLTQRGFQRLTEISPTEATLGDLSEIGRWPSEEEESSSEEEEASETETEA